MKLVEYADAEMMAIDLANVLAGELTAVLEHEERAFFVVPGGNTPGPIFDTLCAADLDWSRVDVALSDERWLPAVHVRSNTRLITERLLQERAAAATMVPLYKKAEEPEEALADLITGIEPKLPIDVLLVGMGDDMHVASLFPEGDQLMQGLAANAPVLIPMRAPNAPEPRLSMSARVLNGAIAKHLVITGAGKRAALERARSTDPLVAPVAAILDGTTVHWAP
ncbi:6-phosphogluconolactonase [Roseovarius sp. EL26]|uniref:6-phosphogluconolactonase n=1 Tax=Roseovarius sp. EL26 TaxID=2126672 RepID=UPI000EA2C929|nr:6-phosphogluconolactonase [Roseovarius sp. EL26]